MHVLLIADMEGVSGVVDHRECWPAFPEYWRTGRQRFTADVSAAVHGLVDGGASAVTVAVMHGGRSWPNLIVSELPKQATLWSGTNWASWAGEYDAVFILGQHARCGTSNGFMSHTHCPGLRLAIDEHLITESHNIALIAGHPVLGVTGDAALESQIDGCLTGTPFLATKHSRSRTETTPAWSSQQEGQLAIRAFANRCVRDSSQRRTPALPRHFTLRVALAPHLLETLTPEDGFIREHPAVAARAASDWNRDALPAFWLAARAATRAWEAAQGDVSTRSEDVMQRQNPIALERFRWYLDNWMHAAEADWPPESEEKPTSISAEGTRRDWKGQATCSDTF